MRFVRPDGALVDVFQVVSQMTDESGQAYPFTVDTLLDRAVGAEGYYGVYTVNAHTDTVSSPEVYVVVERYIYVANTETSAMVLRSL